LIDTLWDIVDKPYNGKITKNKSVLTVKNAKGNEGVKFKARLVGRTQLC